MNKKRGDKFILGFWNYNDIQHSGIDQIPRWADLGLNVAMTPYLRNDDEAKAFLPSWLDALAANGMKAILRFNDIGDSVLKNKGEAFFREAFMRRYNEFGKHPGVLGFYPGEEPNEGNYQYFAEELRLMNEMAPELTPFVDLGACEEHTRYIGEHAHTPNCGFGNYSQMEPEERGTDDYFRIMRKQIEVCLRMMWTAGRPFCPPVTIVSASPVTTITYGRSTPPPPADAPVSCGSVCTTSSSRRTITVLRSTNSVRTASITTICAVPRRDSCTITVS